MKHIQQGDIDGNLDIVSKYLVTYDEIVTQTLIRYMSKYSSLEYSSFCDKIISVEPNLEDAMKTVAQQLKQQGREEGLEQGRIQEKQDMAKNMLQYGDSIDKISAITGLEKSTILDLQKDVDNSKKR